MYLMNYLIKKIKRGDKKTINLCYLDIIERIIYLLSSWGASIPHPCSLLFHS